MKTTKKKTTKKLKLDDAEGLTVREYLQSLTPGTKEHRAAFKFFTAKLTEACYSELQP
jgi:hypothetical protein